MILGIVGSQRARTWISKSATISRRRGGDGKYSIQSLYPRLVAFDDKILARRTKVEWWHDERLLSVRGCRVIKHKFRHWVGHGAESSAGSGCQGLNGTRTRGLVWQVGGSHGGLHGRTCARERERERAGSVMGIGNQWIEGSQRQSTKCHGRKSGRPIPPPQGPQGRSYIDSARMVDETERRQRRISERGQWMSGLQCARGHGDPQSCRSREAICNALEIGRYLQRFRAAVGTIVRWVCVCMCARGAVFGHGQGMRDVGDDGFPLRLPLRLPSWVASSHRHCLKTDTLTAPGGDICDVIGRLAGWRNPRQCSVMSAAGD